MTLLITNRGREAFHIIGLTGPLASIAWVEAMKSDMFFKKTPISHSLVHCSVIFLCTMWTAVVYTSLLSISGCRPKA